MKMLIKNIYIIFICFTLLLVSCQTELDDSENKNHFDVNLDNLPLKSDRFTVWLQEPLYPQDYIVKPLEDAMTKLHSIICLTI